VSYIFTIITAFLLPAALYGQKVQVPEVVGNQLAGINDQFSAVLEEECPRGTCYPVGCEVSRFLTLDEQQTSSMPGLETAGDPDVKAQYKLAAVRCEFTYEPGLGAAELGNLRQRIIQRTKPIGVSLQLVSRPLDPRPAAAVADGPAAGKSPDLWSTLLPFIPWFLTAFLTLAGVMLLVWTFRRLGKPAPAAAVEAAAENSEATNAEPTAAMITSRIEEIKNQIKSSPQISESALRLAFEKSDFDELVLFVRHFGTEELGPFRSKSEYFEKLNTLSQKFNEATDKESAAATWAFLDRLEKSLTAARVRVEQAQTKDEFNFLFALTADEIMGLLREVSEAEAVTVISYLPRELRERCFVAAGSVFTGKVIQALTNLEKVSDAQARVLALKLQKIYGEKGSEFKTVHVARGSMLEDALNSLPPLERKTIVSGIEKTRPKFLATMAPEMFLDESLLYVPEDVLTEAFMRVSPAEGASYLLSFTDGRKVSDRLKPKLRDAIKKTSIYEPNPDLAGRTRETIAAFIKAKHNSGALDLRRINENLIS